MNACAMIERCAQRQVRVLAANPKSALAFGCLKALPLDVQDIGRHHILWGVVGPSYPQCSLIMIKEEAYVLSNEPQQWYVKVG